MQILRHEVLQRVRCEPNLALEGVLHLNSECSFWLVQDGELIGGERGVLAKCRGAVGRCLDCSRQLRVRVRSDVESATWGEQRLTRWVVVGSVDPAATP